MGGGGWGLVAPRRNLHVATGGEEEGGLHHTFAVFLTLLGYNSEYLSVLAMDASFVRL